MRSASRAFDPVDESRLAEAVPFPPEDRVVREAGLGALYHACSKRLARCFARHAGHDAADLVHDAFVRLAALNPQAARAIEKPEAYLNIVATNLLRDRARQAARRALERAEATVLFERGTDDPHRLLEERQALMRLERAVDRMPTRRRRIFLLHRVEGLTYAEIAKEVGMSVKGVKKQMAKALFELRREVSPS